MDCRPRSASTRSRISQSARALPRRRKPLNWAAGLLATMVVFLCGPALAEPLPVVASFSILGDLTRQVGGERVAVDVLVGPDGDAHVFSPAPADAKKLAAAKLVVVNGLGLEGWLARLIKSSGTKAPIIVASNGIKTITGPEEDGHDHAGHSHAGKGQSGKGHDHGAIDPHGWQSIANAKIYVTNIRDGLIAADPAGKADYDARASAYLAKLDALEASVKTAIAQIPAERRRIITTHDAFGYFADAYGLTVIAPQGISTEAEASAKDVARVIRQIKQEKVPAAFLENIADPRLLERITKESGARVGGRLYSDALSPPDGPAGTYIDMMTSNVNTLSKALTP